MLNITLHISSASICSGCFGDTYSAGQRLVSGNLPRAKSSNVISRVERSRMEIIDNFPTCVACGKAYFFIYLTFRPLDLNYD